MVPPSRIATATSRIRPPTWARTPVVSTSTTAKRACSRDSDAGLEVIPSERQGHAPRTAATAHQLAAVHRDHRPVAVVQDRNSTRLNSSHTVISYAVFCLKKKKTSEVW